MQLRLSPIATAPIAPGHHFGPCLVGPGVESDWTIGRWNGAGWYDDDGFALSPMVWTALPAIEDACNATHPCP